MDFIIGWKPYKTEFHGIPVTMNLRPLKRSGMLLLTPYIGAFQAGGGFDQLSDEGKSKYQTTMFEMQGVCQELFKEHVQDIQGFTIDGKAPSIEQIAEESVFLPLCMDIISQLMMISNLDQDSEKNSGGQSDDTMQG